MIDRHLLILLTPPSPRDRCLRRIKVWDAEGMRFRYRQSIRYYVQERVKKAPQMQQQFQPMSSNSLMPRMV
jgi:hypothetical protein